MIHKDEYKTAVCLIEKTRA